MIRFQARPVPPLIAFRSKTTPFESTMRWLRFHGVDVEQKAAAKRGRQKPKPAPKLEVSVFLNF